jgi:peptidoglycan/xylan/chitin deacetylase (PgdA/CDA1 family)
MSGFGTMAYQLAVRSGLVAASRRLRSAATVFCYHNVVPDSLENGTGDGPLHLGISRLHAHLDWIQSVFEVVPVAALLQRIRSGGTVRGLAALTFDDAYRGVLTHALPELRARRIPATIFVVSEASRNPEPFWWDRLGAEGRLDDATRSDCLERLGGSAAAIDVEYPPHPGIHHEDVTLPATLPDLRAALGDGIDAGSHTRTHPNLTSLSVAALDEELAGSRAALAEALGEEPHLVSFPYGSTNAAVRAAAVRAGYQGGIALSYGRVRAGADPFDLTRVNVPASLSTPALACWASGIRWQHSR